MHYFNDKESALEEAQKRLSEIRKAPEKYGFRVFRAVAQFSPYKGKWYPSLEALRVVETRQKRGKKRETVGAVWGSCDADAEANARTAKRDLPPWPDTRISYVTDPQGNIPHEIAPLIFLDEVIEANQLTN